MVCARTRRTTGLHAHRCPEHGRGARGFESSFEVCAPASCDDHHMKVGGLALLLVGACGDVKAPSGLPDAPLDAAQRRCDPGKAFGTPVPVSELNTTAAEGVPYLSLDELTITFGSTRPGGLGSSD